jgi:hypothetical protein
VDLLLPPPVLLVPVLLHPLVVEVIGLPLPLPLPLPLSYLRDFLSLLLLAGGTVRDGIDVVRVVLVSVFAKVVVVSRFATVPEGMRRREKEGEGGRRREQEKEGEGRSRCGPTLL